MIANGLHIGLVGPLPPPFGGMANQTRQLAELLRKEGASVYLIQTNADYRPVVIARVPFVRAFFRLIAYLAELWRVTRVCNILHIMANSGWSWHLFAVPAIWIAKARKRPVIVNYHGGEAEKFLARSANSFRFSIRRVTKLVVPSGFLKDVFSRFEIQSEVVPNVIDIDRFNPSSPSRQIRRRFLVARNLEPVYDNETAILAFAIVHRLFPDATLTITGSGPLEKTLRNLVVRMQLERAVSFTGKLDREAMSRVYREADIAINPSLADNMPVSVMEALASGIPVVSTNVGGIPFMLEDGKTALLVPPRSPEAMANAMLRLMNDPALSDALVQEGIVEAKKYTWSHVWPVLAQKYAVALNAARTRA